MKLLVISKTAIIKQICNLVAIKLELDLTIIEENIVDTNYDLIIVEDELCNINFPINSYAKRVGIISKNNDSKFENDFLIGKPFMPSTLLTILEEQISLIKTPKIIEQTNYIEDDLVDNNEEIVLAEDFLETLADDISDEIEDENDESIVSATSSTEGGILDSKELSKIQDILDFNSNNTFQLDKETLEDEDWINLSDIIDQAIDEVREYQFNAHEPIKLMLNDYSMKELNPLLHKLDQNIIDALTNGEEINLKLKLDKK